MSVDKAQISESKQAHHVNAPCFCNDPYLIMSKLYPHLGWPGGVGLGPWSVLLSRSQI